MFDGEKVEVVYGSEDPSFRYAELINLIELDNVHLNIAEGVEHNFSEHTEMLQDIIMDYLS